MDTSWIHVGDKYKIEIRRQGINGEGIGYQNQLAIFVDGAIAQEIVEVEITAVHPNFAAAKILSIEKASPKRVDPPCPFYIRCGGCQLQHIDYVEQQKIKQSILKQALKRYTSLDVDRLPMEKTIGMKPGYGYRNKSQMPLRNTPIGLAMGLFQPGSNKFVPIDDCIVQDPVVNRVNQSVLEILKKHQLEAADSTHKDGILLHLVTRHLASTGQVQVTIVATRPSHSFKAIATQIVRQNPMVKSVHLSINKEGSVAIFGRNTELLYGEPFIQEKLDGLTISLSPEAFHQLNSKQMVRLYDVIMKHLAFTGTETVVDGYCGVGITSLLLAKRARHVIGIDYSEPSIADATMNAKNNGIDNVRFIADRVEKALPGVIQKSGRPDIIVLDPPRTGLEESLVALLLQAAIPMIVYVSCNPSTLAKNLASLLPAYDIQLIQPIDMFPQTASVESVVYLKLRA